MQHDEAPNEVPQFIGSADVCKRLGIDRGTLTRWIQLGRIKPAGKLPGANGAYLWDPVYIDALAAAGGPPATDGPSWAPHGNTGIPYDARDVS